MSLRSKILLAIGLLCTVLVIVAGAVIARLSLSGYTRLEQQSLTRDMERITNTLEAEVSELTVKLRDYGWWDDTAAFVQGSYPSYAEDNILDDYMASALGLDLLIIADNQGTIFYGKEYDDSGAVEPSSEVLSVLESYLTRSSDDITETSGILRLPKGAALFVVTPVMNNGGAAPAFGTMIAANYLNEDYVAELAEQTRLSPQFYLNDAKDLPADVVGAKSDLEQNDVPALVKPLNSETVGVYAFIHDINNNHVGIVRIEEPRSIYRQGLHQLVAMLISLLVIGAMLIGLVLVLLERTVLKRLSDLSKSVRAISESGDITARTTLEGKDELALLSKDINRMLASLEHQEEVLRQSNKELEQFAYIASHDLQEPLRKVQAFSDRLANKYADKLDDDGKLYISRMQDASNRMRTLIQDLLSYSRIRSKGQEFVPVDLNEIVRGVISDLEVRLEQTEGRIKVGDLPVVLADPVQMRQVFQNLIGNALKFKKSGVPPVVQVAAKLGKNGHTIVVQDNGIGFEQEYAERVFEIFQRLHGRSEYEGTGMGLAIVKKILERHVGSIRAESEKGKGSRFILTLPNHSSPEEMVRKTFVEDTPREDKPSQASATEMEKEFA